MRWEKVRSNASQIFFQLWLNEKKLLSVEYHPQTNSSRIEWEGTKRVFLITKEGPNEKQIVLRNEYGVQIGFLETDKSQPLNGILELDDQQFKYQVTTNPPTLNLYKTDPLSPQITCSFTNSDEKSPISFIKEKKLAEVHHFLLISMCWYLSLPAAKRWIKEFTE